LTEPALPEPGRPGRDRIIDDLGRQWLQKVAELRKVKVPGPDADPPAVYKALLEVRGNLDRAEEILSQAMSLRSGAEIRAREMTERADDELDTRINARAARAREYEAARERFAAARLDVLGKLQEARSAQKQADLAVSVESRIRLAYRGLESLRSDLQTALRHVSWESSLDR